MPLTALSFVHRARSYLHICHRTLRNQPNHSVCGAYIFDLPTSIFWMSLLPSFLVLLLRVRMIGKRSTLTNICLGDRRFDNSQLHPGIVSLGLKIADGGLDGSDSRCTAMLMAFKQVLFTCGATSCCCCCYCCVVCCSSCFALHTIIGVACFLLLLLLLVWKLKIIIFLVAGVALITYSGSKLSCVCFCLR